MKSLDSLHFSGCTTILFTKITAIPSDSEAHGAMSGQVCHGVGGSTHQKGQDLQHESDLSSACEGHGVCSLAPVHEKDATSSILDIIG